MTKKIVLYSVVLIGVVVAMAGFSLSIIQMFSGASPSPTQPPEAEAPLDIPTEGRLPEEIVVDALLLDLDTRLEQQGITQDQQERKLDRLEQLRISTYSKEQSK